MKPHRLEQLSDGIFAIVMTILVFELRIPAVPADVSNLGMWQMMLSVAPVFLSYMLSFAMLFTYWRAHYFFISVYAKNIDMTLTNINAVFFLFVGIVPFSTSLLGSWSDIELPIIIFSVNIILIGLCLYSMRNYVFNSPHIKNIEVSPEEISRGTIRTMVPVISAAIAIPLSFLSHGIALTLLTTAILFNFSQTSSRLFSRLMRVS